MFDLALARKCSQACALSYSGDLDVVGKFLGLKQVHSKAISDQFVVAGTTDTENWIVFRGTDSVGGWIGDLEANLIQTTMFQGKVHLGFHDAFMSLADWLKGKITPGLPLQITGHSLGASLAVLASYYFPTNLDVYTFGSPAVGNLEFAKAYNALVKNHYRVVNDLDPVIHLPLIGYEHVGKEFRLPEGGRSSIFRYLSDILSHAKKGVGPFLIDAISNHFSEQYVQALNDFDLSVSTFSRVKRLFVKRK